MQELYLLKVNLMIKTINIIIILIISLLNSDYSSNINKETTMPIYDITINDIEGNTIKLSDYKGKYVLFVNVASNCGFTRQYRELQKLYNLSLIHI